MKRHPLLLFLSILVICLFFIMLTSVNCLFSPMRTNVNHEDYAHFHRLTGFRANSILFVDALKPSMMGEGGHLTYGALVSNVAEETLREKGWEKQENLASLQFNPGSSLRMIADSNHNIYIRGEDRHQVVLIWSPYGNDAYLIFVSADPYLAFPEMYGFSDGNLRQTTGPHGQGQTLSLQQRTARHCNSQHSTNRC